MVATTKGFGHQTLPAVQDPVVDAKLSLRGQFIQLPNAPVITGRNRQVAGLKRQRLPVNVSCIF